MAYACDMSEDCQPTKTTYPAIFSHADPSCIFGYLVLLRKESPVASAVETRRAITVLPLAVHKLGFGGSLYLNTAVSISQRHPVRGDVRIGATA